jgi:3-oxoacyl-[acyl-carrier protein] reductase
MSAVVAITGSSRGIGLGLAKSYVSRGFRVVGLSRGSSTFQDERYMHIVADVTSEASVKEAFTRINQELGRLDLLINNAGVLTSQYSMLMPSSAAGQMLNTNVLGAFHASKEATKMMMRRKWGRIVSMSSMAVPLSPSGDAMYAASKAALTQFTRVFAKEVAGYGITCNIAGVSAIETEMMKKIPPEKLREIIANLPLKRESTMEDITNVLDFFMKEESSGITGQILYLGGVF